MPIENGRQVGGGENERRRRRWRAELIALAGELKLAKERIASLERRLEREQDAYEDLIGQMRAENDTQRRTIERLLIEKRG